MNFIASVLFSSLLHLFSADTTQYQLVVGSYTQKGNPGIEVYTVNSVTGKPTLQYTKDNPSASYLTLTKDGKYLYAVSEGNGEKSAVNAYQLNSQNNFEKITVFLYFYV